MKVLKRKVPGKDAEVELVYYALYVQDDDRIVGWTPDKKNAQLFTPERAVVVIANQQPSMREHLEAVDDRDG